MSGTVVLLGTVLLFCVIVNGYVIGGGAAENGGGTYNYGGSTNIGGGVQPTYNNGGSSSGGSYYCTSNTDCSIGQSCISSVNGVRICLANSNTNSGTTTSSCTSNADCYSGETCVITATSRACQVQVGGYVGHARQDPPKKRGSLNSPCSRDSHCVAHLVCTLYFGELMCRPPVKSVVPLRCETESQCPSSQYLCVFSTAIQDRVCYRYGDTVTDGYVIPVKHQIALTSTSTTTTPKPHSKPKPVTDESHAVFEDPEESKAIFSEDRAALSKRHDNDAPREPIYVAMSVDDNDTPHVDAVRDEFVDDEPVDPAAIVCDKDYHCRMGESCTARIRFVDRNVTMCRYDTAKRNRQCIYHSDCLSGQRCKSKPGNTEATCETDISATLGNIACFYDYECSGGEKCTAVGDDAKKAEKRFVCRPAQTQDPRTNQVCVTNADCPFQQVCRRSAGLSMCVNVSIAQNPALIHQHFVQLFRTLLFI